MRRFLWFVFGLAVLGVGLWFLGPRETADGPIAFDPRALGNDLDSYLFQAERDVPNMVRGAQKHILWANPARKNKTPLSVVYIHGFSATLQEVRPLPDLVARSLGANLFFARLTGHGRDGAAMAEASAQDWRADVAEAIEIGRRIGDRVVLIGTSTGGALVTLALTQPDISRDVAGAVLISPNFALQEEGAGMLTWPFARSFVPLVAGSDRFFVPENPDHGKWWTTRYPTVALLPMAAVTKAAIEAPHGQIDVPALFLFSDADQVVRAEATRQVADAWGGAVTLWPVEMGRGDDRFSHVIAGDILSPGQTEPLTERILEWARERNLQK